MFNSWNDVYNLNHVWKCYWVLVRGYIFFYLFVSVSHNHSKQLCEDKGWTLFGWNRSVSLKNGKNNRKPMLNDKGRMNTKKFHCGYRHGTTTLREILIFAFGIRYTSLDLKLIIIIIITVVLTIRISLLAS